MQEKQKIVDKLVGAANVGRTANMELDKMAILLELLEDYVKHPKFNKEKQLNIALSYSNNATAMEGTKQEQDRYAELVEEANLNVENYNCTTVDEDKPAKQSKGKKKAG